MKSLSRVIKSSNLVISRAREVGSRLESIPCVQAEPMAHYEVACATEINQGTSLFGEDESQAIIAETEAIVKQLLEKAEQQAAVTIQEAREQAREILGQAKSEAEILKQDAAQRGYREGQEKIAQEMEEARLNALQEAELLTSHARRERERILNEAEPQVVDLAIAVAQKVIGRQLKLHPETVRDITREALGKVRGIDQLVIKVHETSYEALRSGWEEVAPDSETARRCRIEVDNLVEPGGCVVDTQAGYIDAQVSTQINAITNALEQVKNGES